jgi:phage replication-related protein YjqB (UPF0714/DUF867 family)
MPDKYRSFAALARGEVEGRDYRIGLRKRRGTIVVIAIHGGGIESGTSEVADGIAADDVSFYTFEGIKSRRNRDLHITSHRFDEPQCRVLVNEASGVISIHGEDSKQQVVFLGGRDRERLNALRESLTFSGFRVETHKKLSLQGLDPRNICNRTKNGCGVQLELSFGLRRSFFKSLAKTGRLGKTERFDLFVAAVREAVV